MSYLSDSQKHMMMQAFPQLEAICRESRETEAELLEGIANFLLTLATQAQGKELAYRPHVESPQHGRIGFDRRRMT